jgi:hypothetical protein
MIDLSKELPRLLPLAVGWAWLRSSEILETDAYLAWHCRCWGGARNEIFGTMPDGYIVVPKGAEADP